MNPTSLTNDRLVAGGGLPLQENTIQLSKCRATANIERSGVELDSQDSGETRLAPLADD